MIRAILVILALLATVNLVYRVIKKKPKKAAIILTVAIYLMIGFVSAGDKKTGYKMLEGEWEFSSMTIAGQTTPVTGTGGSFEFKDDGSCLMTMNGSVSEGTWEEMDFDENLGEGFTESLKEKGAWMGTVKFTDGVLYAYILEDQLIVQMDSENGMLFVKK